MDYTGFRAAVSKGMSLPNDEPRRRNLAPVVRMKYLDELIRRLLRRAGGGVNGLGLQALELQVHEVGLVETVKFGRGGGCHRW